VKTAVKAFVGSDGVDEDTRETNDGSRKKSRSFYPLLRFKIQFENPDPDPDLYFIFNFYFNNRTVTQNHRNDILEISSTYKRNWKPS